MRAKKYHFSFKFERNLAHLSKKRLTLNQPVSENVEVAPKNWKNRVSVTILEKKISTEIRRDVNFTRE
jgi:hypothetical protein